MRWRTHRALTRRVLRRLGLGGDVIEACLEGVVEPDRRIEYSLAITPRGRVRLARKPHHSFWRASERLKGEYAAYIEMPGSWLNIRFYGDREVSEQIFIIPFRDGDDVKYFVVRGVREGDRRVTRCDMVRIMGWDQLIEYLGDVWEELWDVALFKLKVAEASMP